MQPDPYAAWLKERVREADQSRDEAMRADKENSRSHFAGRQEMAQEALQHYEEHPRYSVEELCSDAVIKAAGARTMEEHHFRPYDEIARTFIEAAFTFLTQQEVGGRIGAGPASGEGKSEQAALPAATSSADSVTTSTQGGDAVDLRGPSGCAGKRHVTGGGAGNGPASETCECGHGRDQHYSLLSTTSCSRCPCEAFTSVQHHSKPQVGEGNGR